MENTQNIEFDPYALAKEIRLAGLTRSEVCDKAGVSRNTFSNWLGGNKPQVDKVEKVKIAFQQLKEN